MTYLDEYSSLWDRCDASRRVEGANWYSKALDEVSDGFQGGTKSFPPTDRMTSFGPQGTRIETLTAVCSHLSPRIDWRRNIVATHAMLDGGPKPSYIMTGPWERARKAFISTDPMGTFSKAARKTYAFARALAGDERSAVIDTHMIHAGLGYRPGYNALSTADYRRLYGDALVALNELSDSTATPVTHLQASLWLQWKDEKTAQMVEVPR